MNIKVLLLIFIACFFYAEKIFSSSQYVRIAITPSYPHIQDTIYASIDVDSIIFDFSKADTAYHILPFSDMPSTSFITIHNNKSILIYLPHQQKGVHQLSFVISKNNSVNIVSKTIVVRNKTWWLWTLFGIIGGLGLFLFGINYMSDGFVRLMGHRLHGVIQRFSKTAFASINSGVFLTTVMQSSSAASIFLIRLADNELISFKQTIGIIIGAALGTTLTIQIIALQINSYALFLIALGFIFSFLTRKNELKLFGQILTGLGLLYLGLLIMSNAASSIKSVESILHFLSQLSNPILGMLIGIVFTAVTQSASAFIGLLIMLGSLNLLSLDASIALFIGSNIGTSVPVLFAMKNVSTDAKNVAYFHLFYRIAGALLFIFWIPVFSKIVVEISNFIAGVNVSMPHLIANAHTIMYILLTLLATPLIPWIYRRYASMVKTEKKNKSTMQPKYLNTQSLDSPSIAIILAKKETMHTANVVKHMVEQLLPLFLQKDKKILTELEKTEKYVNLLQDKITEYLLELNKTTTQEKIIKELYELLAIIKELEEIADIVDTNLLPKARYWLENNFDFSEQGKNELIEFHRRCLNQLSSVIELMATFNEHKAKKIKKKETETIRLAFELEKSHFARLMEQTDKTLQSSKTHIELLGMMQAISRHATQIVDILYHTI